MNIEWLCSHEDHLESQVCVEEAFRTWENYSLLGDICFEVLAQMTLNVHCQP